MKKAFRIGYYRYFEDETFKAHIAFVNKNLNIIDEIALFAEYSHHGYWALDECKRIASIIKERFCAYRKIGIKSVGINVLCTIGHLDEAWTVLPKPPMQTMVDIDGGVSKSCLCISSETYRNYIAEKYRIFAESGPDFIWVDDDFRVHNHGVQNPCYCPQCIAKFNDLYGYKTNADELAKIIHSGNKDNKIATAWHDYQDNLFLTLADTIKNAIISVDPNIEIGLMTVTWNKNTNKWLTRFNAVKGRPGGGFYEDSVPIQSLHKALKTGYQKEIYPAHVEDIQYEFENFPYQKLMKSMTISALECTGALMYGCNGIAYNTSFCYDYPEIMEMIFKYSKQWEVLDNFNRGTKSFGVYANNLETAGFFMDIGIPMSSSSNTYVRVVRDEELKELGESELIKIFSRGVIMHASGLPILKKRGIERFAGVKISKIYDNGCLERFTDDSINGIYSGYERDIFQSFSKKLREEFSYVIVPIDDAVKVKCLAILETIHKEELGMSTSLYENELGGRVAVLGYFFESLMNTEQKRLQLQNLIEHLNREKMFLRIQSPCKLVSIVRSDGEDFVTVMIVNASCDGAQNVVVEFATERKIIKTIGTDGELSNVKFTICQGKLHANIGNIAAWQYKLLVLE